MNITKEQADKVIAALEDSRSQVVVYGQDYHPGLESVVLEDIDEALTIMRGLSEDAEPVNRCITELLAFAKDHPGTYIFPSWDGSRVMKYLATSPQAAQTAVKSESLAQAAQALERVTWQPIETAPKDGTQVMLTNGISVAHGNWLHAEPFIREIRDLEGRYIDQDESDGYDGWIDFIGGMMPEPTLWMPLPTPPESKG